MPHPSQRDLDDIVEDFVLGDGCLSLDERLIQSFLEKSAHCAEPEAERLRRLAVALEGADLKRGWDALGYLYSRACGSDPQDPIVAHSWGLSAMRYAQNEGDPIRRLRLLEDAEHALAKALELRPADPEMAFALGVFHYSADRAPSPEDLRRAISFFDLALEHSPGHPMSRLFRGHSRFRLGDYAGAKHDYLAVDTASLIRENPQWRWRADRLQGQLALCEAKLGHTKQALIRCQSIIDEFDSLSTEEALLRIRNLDSTLAAFSEIAPPNSPWTRKVLRLLERLGIPLPPKRGD